MNSASDQETIQINIRNSPALERMNKKKIASAEPDSSEDDSALKKYERNHPRNSPSPSPAPAKAR